MKVFANSLSSTIAIKATKLSRELSGVEAVRDVSFKAHFGRIFGLLGPNGAGKTTTLRMLACLLEPSTGSLEICGNSISNRLEEVKRDIGFMTSGMKLYEAFTPEESLLYFGRLRGMSKASLRQKIDQLVADFEMSQFYRKRFGKLSSGEQQRTTIANALLHDPKILILDEITLSLDVISSAVILDFIKRERDRGRCIVFSTHSMGEAEYLCDDIGFIHQGQIITQGTARKIIHGSGAGSLTEAFLNAVKQVKGVAA